MPKPDQACARRCLVCHAISQPLEYLSTVCSFGFQLTPCAMIATMCLPLTTTTPSASCTLASTNFGPGRWAPSCAKVESGFRYTPTTCFETFPFPEPDDAQRAAISKAASRLNELREGWLNPTDANGNPALNAKDLKKRTLTNLYNQRPSWLANAHAELDDAVAAAYGWPANLDDAAILERLLALNLQRSDQQEAAAP